MLVMDGVDLVIRPHFVVVADADGDVDDRHCIGRGCDSNIDTNEQCIILIIF